MNQNKISNPLSDSQLKSINDLVDEVGKRQLQDFGQINSDIKPDGTLITECDRWSDKKIVQGLSKIAYGCLLYTSPSPRDRTRSRMPSSA